MKIHVSTTTAPDATDAVRELGAEIERQGRAPDFISIHASAAYDIATLQAAASD